MNEHHYDLDLAQWLESDPDLNGLINVQGAPLDSGAATQERSPLRECLADSATLPTIATQNKPRFIRSADESCRLAIYAVISVAICVV